MPKLEGRVLNYASEIEPDTLEQAQRAASMPFIEGHLALMPDAHLGKGATIGSVIPTRGAIIPSAVGVDIGCGMAALRLNLTASELPDDLWPLLSAFERAIPAGVGKEHSKASELARSFLFETSQDRDSWLTEQQAQKTIKQMGTLGSGNHFVEVCLDAEEKVWLVLHSGSRGIGNSLARVHIEKAKGIMERYFIELPDPDLAYFVEGTPEFDAYWKDLQWAQHYAKENRRAMLSAGLAEMRDFLGRALRVTLGVNCHHNYSALEHHHGKNVYVTRKGAIRAREGELGIIPGSMGTNSYIVRGLGNPGSYSSAPHGAGRRMSRKAAFRQYSAEDLAAAMEGKTWLAGKAKKLVDEIPDSYKDIHTVIRDSAELVEVVFELDQILNYKGA